MAFAAPAAAWGLVFQPTKLLAGKVGVPYRVVIRVSLHGHHPAMGKSDYASYTVNCFGADKEGGFIDDCKKMPPGLKITPYSGPGCSPPATKPACILLAGKPSKAGRYTFRLSVPNEDSIGVRGILYSYTLVITH